MLRNIYLITLLLLIGCSVSGPKSAQEKSTARPQLSERVAFIEQYVNFRRSYKSLEYVVEYHNNGGVVLSGPSDWDIKMLVMIPAEEMNDWIPAKLNATKRPVPKWVADMPGKIATSGIAEWYIDGGKIIGVDREKSIVAFRANSMPNSDWDK